MTMLVFLSASAPALIISTELWNGLRLTKHFFEKSHVTSYSRRLPGSKAYFWLKFVAADNPLAPSRVLTAAIGGLVLSPQSSAPFHRIPVSPLPCPVEFSRLALE